MFTDNKNPTAFSFLYRFFGETPPHERNPVLMDAQLDSYFSRMPAGISINIMNVLFVGFGFRDVLPGLQMLAWMACLGSVLAVRIVVFRRRQGLLATRGATWFEHYSILEASLMSLLWAVGLALMMGHASEHQVALLGIIAACSMAGGSITSFQMMPVSAYLYIFIMGLSLFPFFLSLKISLAIISIVMIITYWIVLILTIKGLFSDFAVRVIHEHELQDEVQTTQILLSDYETFGSDLLWEVDADGRVINVSPRLIETAGLPAQYASSGAHFTDLFEDSAEKETLQEHIEKNIAFRDLTLKRRGVDKPLWWRLSAGVVDKLGGDTRMRGVAADVTPVKVAEERLMYLAFYDALTDMPNRVLFHEELERKCSTLSANGALAVMYLDLDNFKIINDTLGHGVGDKLLESVATRIKHCIAASDMAARLGGDEFAIVLTSIASREDAQTIADRLIGSMQSPFSIDNQQIRSSVSIGIVIAYATEPANADDLMRHADLALYEAKGRGRNRSCFYDPVMSAAVQRRHQLEAGLRLAPAAGELALHYQALVDIESGEINGFEALMRWQHPELGNISPAEFIPLAENIGVIVQMGEWAIQQAARDLASWPEHIHVAINLSVVQLTSAELLPTIINAMASSGIAPQRFEFEVTESVMLESSGKELQALRWLHQLGVRIALDDFGTGFSSMNYMLKFPFNKIKIDKSFVDNIVTSTESRAVVRAIVGLASDLGMLTTAEDIERQEQLDVLRKNGCTQAQGYLFAKPKPYAEISFQPGI